MRSNCQMQFSTNMIYLIFCSGPLEILNLHFINQAYLLGEESRKSKINVNSTFFLKNCQLEKLINFKLCVCRQYLRIPTKNPTTAFFLHFLHSFFTEIGLHTNEILYIDKYQIFKVPKKVNYCSTDGQDIWKVVVISKIKVLAFLPFFEQVH